MAIAFVSAVLNIHFTKQSKFFIWNWRQSLRLVLNCMSIVWRWRLLWTQSHHSSAPKCKHLQLVEKFPLQILFGEQLITFTRHCLFSTSNITLSVLLCNFFFLKLLYKNVLKVLFRRVTRHHLTSTILLNF